MFKKKEEKGQASEANKVNETAPASEPNESAPANEVNESAPASEPDETKKAGEANEAGPASKPAEPDWKTLYALTLADFDNYKKRAARDREETYRYAEADILKDVLPAVDNLQLALDSARERADDPFVKGVKLVYDTLLSSLKEHGAEPFDSIGRELDTEKMEAIATLPSPDFEEGKVSIESKRGWMLKGKVLRAAQVVVSSGKPQ